MGNAGGSTSDRAFLFGVVGNGALAGLKIVVGTMAGSRSLAADGWHSSADVVVNGGTWIAHRMAQRGPDEDHHHGHGKLEAFAGMTIGLLLVFAGISVGRTAFASDVELQVGWRVWLALGVAVLSIAVNVWLAVISHRSAQDSDSDGLAALARDNGSDALSSLLVVFGIAGAKVGFAWAEPVVTVMIGLLIVTMGWQSARSGFDVLMDRADPDLRARVEKAARSVGEVRGVQRVRLRPTGKGIAVDMEISVDGSLTVDAGHEIAHAVDDAVRKAYSRVREVHVHVNPAERA